MDRPSIQRSDFPTVRRGYEPDAVDAHLRHIADEVEALRSRGPVASAASSQVQKILEAAESTADQLRSEAGEEAREHVHRVSTAARELLERLGAMHDELGSMMDRLREEAGRLSAELRTLERDVVELAPPVEEEEPEPVAAEPEPEPVVEVPEPEEPVEGTPETAAGKARSKRGRAKAEPQAKPDDEEAARLVALDMALAGTPRDETEQYLAEHYTLADPGAILDDVYALAGS
jgi:DivIVA domain-containing protein